VSCAHALSVDVEDWFQVLNMAHRIDRARWDSLPLRCVESTHRLLDLFARRQAKATFFFLGWIAERAPELVRAVRDAGHEIGSHGYDHRLLPELGQQGFADDLRRTNAALLAAGAAAPTVFRACTWSITVRTPWAVDELLAQGFRIDSSIFPVRHPDYGVRRAPSRPYRLVGRNGELLELPPLVLELFGRRLPVGGGGYLRLFPLALLRAGLRQQERRGVPGCIYLHPWEVDPGQPRQRLGWLRGFRHYVNLHRTEQKLDRLLGEFRFTTVSAALAQWEQARSETRPAVQSGDSWRAKLPALRASELLS
jgi:polysaccharide deacetylase family protein (PEP-CTERM system associated)